MSEPELTIRPGLEKIQAYQPGKPIAEVKRELGIRSVIKLASNENPLGPSPRVLAALRREARNVHFYPDGAAYHLKQALARFLKTAPETILLGNGSNELLVLLGRCYLQAGDEVLTSQKSFAVYTLVAHMMNARLVTVPLRDFVYDLEAMRLAITPATRIIYLANPNNPTGTCVEPGLLRDFVKQVPSHCLVVLDEAYYEYQDPKLRPNSLAWIRERKNLVVLRTFSKAYALAGLRVGYGVASPEIAAVVAKVRDPFNVNSLGQAAALAALQDQAHVRRGVSLARKERKRVSRALEKLGVQVIPSQANFIFVNLGAGAKPVPAANGHEFAKALMRLGVIVRPFSGPFVRITLGTVAQNNKLLRAIKKNLKSF